MLLNIPTKQIGHFFLEFFVNKYNSLTTKEVRPDGHTSLLYACAISLGFGSDELVALTVDVDDFY